MGSFNSQYEDYYSRLRGRNLKKSNNFNYSNRVTSNKGNYIYKRVIRELVGVLILFVFVLSCKIMATPKSIEVYNYSKEVVSNNYDISKVKNTLATLNINDVQKRVTEFLENIKAKVLKEKTYKEKIREEYSLPLKGEITSKFGYREDPLDGKKKLHEGVDINAQLNTEVKASYDGKVKNVGEDKELGKFILIDHGSGIETKYGHLNEIKVKKEDAVKKGDVIAKTGNTGKSTGPHLHFEIFFMGEAQNPEELLSFSKK